MKRFVIVAWAAAVVAWVAVLARRERAEPADPVPAAEATDDAPPWEPPDFDAGPAAEAAAAEPAPVEPATPENTITMPLEDPAFLLWAKKGGDAVKAGEVVAELDAASLRDRLNNQLFAVRAAEATLANARLLRESAELALKEAQAEVEAERARIGRTREMARQEREFALAELKAAKPGPLGDVERKPAEERKQAAERSLREADTREATLKNLTEPRKSKELGAGVAEAQARENEAEAVRAGAVAEADRLRRQIDLCKLKAPRDGLVLYLNAADPKQQGFIPLEPGASVRPGQPMFRIVAGAGRRPAQGGAAD